MSTLDNLLREFAPNGVKTVHLGDVCEIETGTQLNKTELSKTGSYAVLNGGINPSGYYHRHNTEASTIAISQGGASAGYVNFIEKQFWAGAHCFTVKPTNNQIINKYIYYVLKRGQKQLQNAKLGAGIPGLSRKELQKFVLPLPPLEVQHRIVDILDNFTSLEAELNLELKMRQQQFEYYRDKLLAFNNRQDIKYRRLSEVGEFVRGRRFTKNDYVDDGIACIHYGEIYTHYGTSTTNVISHVRSDLASSLRYAMPGDVVIVDVGETVEDVGKAVAWIGDGNVAIHDHCYAFRQTMNPSFVAYYMQTATFRAAKAKYISRTKVNTLMISGFAKIEIPVPTSDEQERIVSMLIKFEELLGNSSKGLPTEIKARRKQYEHYSNKILTFQETGA